MKTNNTNRNARGSRKWPLKFGSAQKTISVLNEQARGCKFLLCVGRVYSNGLNIQNIPAQDDWRLAKTGKQPQRSEQMIERENDQSRQEGETSQWRGGFLVFGGGERETG